MTTAAKLICCTRSGIDQVLTMELCYPRIIHAEVLTHRMFARNSASSRAIPYSKLRESALSQDGAFYPVEYWGSTVDGEKVKGMQAGDVAIDRSVGDSIVDRMKASVIGFCDELHEKGVHKSLINRYLEPFTHITVVVTGLRHWWEAFLRLRHHKAAERHLQRLSISIGEQYLNSWSHSRGVLGVLSGEGIHLPYLRSGEDELLRGVNQIDYVVRMLSVSAARCARISYNVSGITGKAFTLEEDIELGRRLLCPTERSEVGHLGIVDGTVEHSSPMEHCAVSLDLFRALFFREEAVKAFDLGERSVLSPSFVTLRQIKELGCLNDRHF